MKIEIDERPNRAEVRTIYPAGQHGLNRRNVNVQVHYTITAPAGTRMNVWTTSQVLSTIGILSAKNSIR